jgi:hypothetical protein
MDDKYLTQVLMDNGDKDFVKRIFDPENSPVLKNRDGGISTHTMTWAGPDESGTSYVYPTVIRKGDKLVRLSGDDAKEHAKKTGEFIPFKSPSDADDFSKNYKRYWDMSKKYPKGWGKK